MPKMEIPVLDKICFIIPLKVGSMVMALINSLVTFLLAIVLITMAVDVKAAAAAQLKREESEASMSSVVYTIMILMVVLLFLKFLFDLLIVYAVYRDKAGIVKKYCIFWVVFFVLFVIGFLKTMFHMGAGYVIALAVFLAESTYFICIIRSYLKSIKADGIL